MSNKILYYAAMHGIVPKVEEKKVASSAASAASNQTKKSALGGAGGQKKGKRKAKRRNFVLKTPKGTKDYEPEQTRIRERMFQTFRNIFRKHGAVAIETPVFELKDTLTGKYGEDSKLIYDLADQGGEICSLRYDLTVPFARYVAQHGVQSIKRYQLGRVYRRDNPKMERGRYREFYQCDFDIAGTFGEMVPDAEIVTIACEILKALQLGTQFVIKLNHRLLLDGIFAVCGVPVNDFRPICSAVDKLDKLSWAEVRDEMVNIKHLHPEAADRIGEYVKQAGEPRTLLKTLLEDSTLVANKQAKEALRQLGILFDYADAYGVLEHVRFDLSLARGLDYYTGLIFEAILPDSDVGSVAAGGRYDNLVGMFSKKAKIPAVGFSVGVERIFTLLEEKNAKQKDQVPSRASDTIVFVGNFPGPVTLLDRMKVLSTLWAAGIPAETLPQPGGKLKKQLSVAENNGIPFCLLLGDTTDPNASVEMKDLRAPRDSKQKQFTVPQDKLIPFLLAYKQRIEEDDHAHVVRQLLSSILSISIEENKPSAAQ